MRMAGTREEVGNDMRAKDLGMGRTTRKGGEV